MVHQTDEEFKSSKTEEGNLLLGRIYLRQLDQLLSALNRQDNVAGGALIESVLREIVKEVELRTESLTLKEIQDSKVNRRDSGDRRYGYSAEEKEWILDKYDSLADENGSKISRRRKAIKAFNKEDKFDKSGPHESTIREAMQIELSQLVNDASQNEYLTTKEVSELTGWSDRTIRHLRESRQIPYIQHGRKILYPTEGVIAFLDDHRIDPQ